MQAKIILLCDMGSNRCVGGGAGLRDHCTAALYQLGIVHRCLETCHLRRSGLVTLLEAFQGHFRDGTNEGKDFRFLAVLYFTNRLVPILLAMLSKMYYSAYLASIAVTVCMVTLVHLV